MSDLHDAAIEAAAEALKDDQGWLDKEGQEPYLVYLDANPVQAASIVLAALDDPKVRDEMAAVLCARYPCCDHDDDLDTPTCVADADAILRALGGDNG